MINSFTVKNYKALQSVEVPLTQIHVLIGQNDTGKTSLLEAIHAFCTSTQGLLPNAFPSRWVGRELVHSAAQEPVVELAANLVVDQLPDLTYEIGIEFPSQDARDGRTAYERFSLHQGEIKDIPKRGPLNVTMVASRHQFSSAERRDLDLIAETVGISSLYRLDARIMAIPAVIDETRKFRMDPDGFGLPTMLDDILGWDPERFIRLRSDFCEFFPEFRSVHLQTETAGQRIYSSTGLHHMGSANGKGICLETQDGAKIRAQQASDGAILFLGFLALSYLPEPPQVLLIEEPETGVYPKRLNQIIGLLKGMAQDKSRDRFPQIVFTTHSPYLLTPFKPEEVTLMSRRNGSVIARPLRDAPNIDERLGDGEFYLGELWYNLDEEELFQDARLDVGA
jgi:energy-coupling factor transporter ATP-binding protein EcfA2